MSASVLPACYVLKDVKPIAAMMEGRNCESALMGSVVRRAVIASGIVCGQARVNMLEEQYDSKSYLPIGPCAPDCFQSNPCIFSHPGREP